MHMRLKATNQDKGQCNCIIVARELTLGERSTLQVTVTYFIKAMKNQQCDFVPPSLQLPASH